MNVRERLRPRGAKLILIIVLTTFLSLSGIVAKQAAGASENGSVFTDIKPGSKYEEALASLMQQKIIMGYSDGTYRPSEKLNREQASAILARALQLNLEAVNHPGFQDVNECSKYYKSIAAVVNAGIFRGYSDGTFKPERLLTRAEMARILVVAYQLPVDDLVVNPFKDVPSNSWYAPYLTSLIQNKITIGTSPTTFSPNDAVNRGDMALFIYRSQQLEQQPIESMIESQVTTITPDSIRLGNESFALTDEQKKWITPENLSILKNSRIKAHIIGGKISRIETVTLYADGLLSDQKEHSNTVLTGNGAIIDATLIINGDNLSIKNATITSDLIIESEVQNNFYLDNVVVKGSTILSKSLGLDTAEPHNSSVSFNTKNIYNPKLHLHNSILQSVKVTLEGFTIKLTGETKVNKIDLLVDANLQADTRITIPIVRMGAESLHTVLNARIDSLIVENMSSRIILNNDAKIEDLRLELKHNVKFIFLDYELIKHNIIKINGLPNIDWQPPVNGSPSPGVNTNLIAAKNAVASLFMDSTKTALKAGVNQAAIDAAKAKVDLVADGAEKSALVAELQFAQQLLATQLEATANLQAATEAVNALFTDSTKTTLKPSVNQAAIDAAKAKVDLVADGAEKSALRASIEIAQNLLNQPLTAPALAGTVLNVDTVRFTFVDDAIWREKITGVYQNGNSVPIHSSRVNKSIAGMIEINLSGASLRPGTHQFLIKADGFSDALVTIKVPEPLAPPSLTGTAPNADTIQITFVDDAIWRDKITGIYLNGNSAAIHYSRVNKTIAGAIQINLSGASLKPGTHQFLIKSEGFADAVVTIEVPEPLAAPTLTGTAPNADTVLFTFSDDAAWRHKITGVYLNGNSAPIHNSRVNKSDAGIIIIDLTEASLLPGTHEFLFKAEMYEDVTAVINIEP